MQNSSSERRTDALYPITFPLFLPSILLLSAIHYRVFRVFTVTPVLQGT